MKRTLIALIVAPLIPAVLFAHDAGPILSLLLSYFWSFVFGLPVFFILRRIRKEYHICYALAGFSLGFLALLLQGAIHISEIYGAYLFGLLGLAVALCFSLIRGKERRIAEPHATTN
ncbi:MAG TPA: hypothetical protein VNU49_06220 [Opitutaceae bacterium]|jgi:hypothetical protein|nr:hypothetical protein [Opitutaceae bacterium]